MSGVNPNQLDPIWELDFQDPVVSIATAEGMIAVASVSGHAALLDVLSGQKREVLSNHGTGAFFATSSKDGQWLATGGEDGAVRVYRGGGSNPEFSFQERGWAQRGDFSPDGRKFAWCVGKKLKCVDLSTQKTSSLENPSGSITDVSWSSDDIITFCANKRLAQWSVQTEELVKDYSWVGPLNGVRVQPQGGFAVCSTPDPVLHIWNLNSDEDYEMSGFSGRIRAMGFVADGLRLAVGDRSTLLLWDFSGKGPAGRSPKVLGETYGAITVVKCSGNLIAVGTEEGEVIVWDWHAAGAPRAIGGVKGQSVRDLAWSADAKCVVVSQGTGFVRYYRLEK